MMSFTSNAVLISLRILLNVQFSSILRWPFPLKGISSIKRTATFLSFVNRTKSTISSVLIPDCTTTFSFKFKLLFSSSSSVLYTSGKASLRVILANFALFKLSILKLMSFTFPSFSRRSICREIKAPLVVILIASNRSL